MQRYGLHVHGVPMVDMTLTGQRLLRCLREMAPTAPGLDHGDLKELNMHSDDPSELACHPPNAGGGVGQVTSAACQRVHVLSAEGQMPRDTGNPAIDGIVAGVPREGLG